MNKWLLLVALIIIIFLEGCSNGIPAHTTNKSLSPSSAIPLTQTYVNDIFGITIKYPHDWKIVGDSLNTPEMSLIANTPTEALLTQYLPSDGVQKSIDLDFHGSIASIIAPPGQEHIGVAINFGTDANPNWLPLTVGSQIFDTFKDYQCLVDINNVTFAMAPPKLNHSVRISYAINMWSGIATIQPTDKNCAFGIEVMHTVQPFMQWSQNRINSANEPESLYNTQLIESNTTTLSGYPAYEIRYKGKQLGAEPKGQSNYESMETWTFIHDRIYRVLFLAFEPTNYSDYQLTIQDMIQSFHIN